MKVFKVNKHRYLFIIFFLNITIFISKINNYPKIGEEPMNSEIMLGLLSYNNDEVIDSKYIC